jgi:hypothetical protein
MAKYNTAQNSFKFGELGPLYRGRTDSEEYKQGVEWLENFIPIPGSGVANRPGFQYLQSLKDACLIPFSYATTENYIIAITPSGTDISNDTDEIYKIYRVESDSFSTVATESAAQADSSILTPSIDPRLDKDKFHYYQNNDILIITHSSGYMQPVIVARNSEDSFRIIRWGDTTLLPTRIYSQALKLPYLDSNIDEDKVLNPSADSGTITLSAEDSGASAIDFFVARHIGALFRITHGSTEGVCVITDVSSLTQSFSDTDVNTSTDTINISTHGFSTGDEVIFSQVAPEPLVGGSKTYYVIKVDNDNFKVAETSADASDGTAIDLTFVRTGYSSYWVAGDSPSDIASSCTAEVLINFGGSTASDNWKESAWSNYRGWPRTLCGFEQRLYFGGSRHETGKIWGSLVGNIFHFMEERLVQDDGAASGSSGLNYFGDSSTADPFSFVPAGINGNPIQWITPSNVLEIGTLAEEYTATGGDNILSSSSLKVQKQTSVGSEPIQPVRIGNATIFVARGGKEVRQFIFNDRNGSYQAGSLSRLNTEIVNNGYDSTSDTSSYFNYKIVRMSYQESLKTLWFVNSDRKLIGLTIEETTATIAWHRHSLGGTGVEVEGITTVPNVNGTHIDLYTCVSRTIDGSTVYYLEKMGPFFRHAQLDNTSSSEGDQPYFSDSCIKKTPSTTTVSGLSHLEGETVKVLVGANTHADKTVASGEIELDSTPDGSTPVYIGLEYTPKIITLPLATGPSFGTALGQLSRVDRIMLRVYKAMGGKYGPDEDNLEEIKFRDAALTGSPEIELFTGDKYLYIGDTPSTDSKIVITQNEPLPMTILALVYRGVTYE